MDSLCAVVFSTKETRAACFYLKDHRAYIQERLSRSWNETVRKRRQFLDQCINSMF